MKTKFFILTVLLFGLIFQRSSAQNVWDCSAYITITNPPAILGTSSVTPSDIDFGTNSTTRMVLTTNGDLNISNLGNGYMIDNNYVLVNTYSLVTNTAVGVGAGAGTGGDNTFVGGNAGANNTTGIENTYLGYDAGNPFTNITYQDITCLGYNSGGGTLASNNMYFGDNSVTQLNASTAAASTGITGYSDRRIKDNIRENVPGLAFINRLHPVTFNVNLHKENELLGIKDSKDWPGKYDAEKMTISGFIAQQVDSAAQACGYDFCGLKKPSGPNELYRLGYTAFIMPLVKAVQELSDKHDSLIKVVQNMQICLDQLCGAAGGNNPVNGGTPASVQSIALSSTNVPLLYQNTPNPFNSGTKINYYLPEGSTGAAILFYNNSGNQVKMIQLGQTGFGTLNVTSDNLENGIYSYSLVVNGATIDTKRMVLER